MVNYRKEQELPLSYGKVGKSSRVPNLASQKGALCHIVSIYLRDIEVLISASPEAALLGTTSVQPWEKH